MSRITNENILKEKVISMLPKKLKGQDVINSVEIDVFGNSDSPDGISYWVYLNDGYRSENGYGCHTIHEDTLAYLKEEIKHIVAERK